MLKNYLKTAWRSLVKRKYYSILHIVGLSLSILCCMFLFLFVDFHFSFDRYHKHHASTYRIVNEIYFEKTAYIKGASMGMYRELLSGNPNITQVGLMVKDHPFTIGVKAENSAESLFKEDQQVALVSQNWFGMFDYTFLSGSPDELKYPNTGIITKSQASKYFGNTDPLGKTLIFSNDVPVKIVGLISDEPHNSDLKSEIFVSLPSFKQLFPGNEERYFTDWSRIDTHISLFLTLNNSSSSAAMETEINRLAENHLGANAKYYRFHLQPLSDIHFDSNYGGAVQKPLLVTLTIIGMCILAIGSFNYINLSIAQQSGRMQEIGTRKVLGASSWNLFMQFIAETVLVVMLAIGIAVLLFALSFSAVNHSLFAQDPLYKPSFVTGIWFILLLFFSLTGLSGIYPALVLSRIAIFKSFKKMTGTWKTGNLRKVLVVAQNAMACLLIICTFMMLMQVRFLKHTQIGFNSSAVVMIPLPDTALAKKDFIGSRLASIPGIASYSFCHFAPSSQNDWGGSVKFGDRPDWEPWQGMTEVGDSAYVKTFGLHLISGRNIRQSGSPEFLINETMVRKSGFKTTEDVLGKQLLVGEFGDEKGTIVGVVKDFNTRSLIEPIEPVVLTDQPEKYSTIAIRLTGEDAQTAIDHIGENWKAVFPKDVFEYHFTDDQIADLYRTQDLQQKLIWLAAAVAIVISCLGLIGLVSLATSQRTKEIGIRKVLGASVAGIVQLVSRDFLRLVCIAIGIALPLGYWIMHNWLQGFAYHVNIAWWVFALSGISAMALALLAIGLQAARAALVNPVLSLRTE